MPDAEEEKVPGETRDVGAVRILVVEDDPDLRNLVRLELEMAGFEAHGQSDGLAGLAAAHELQPDLVLLDWMMPKLPGTEVCRRLRDDARTRHIPVILLTAKGEVADIEHGFAAGADAYIVKPFSRWELLSHVNTALGLTA